MSAVAEEPATASRTTGLPRLALAPGAWWAATVPPDDVRPATAADPRFAALTARRLGPVRRWMMRHPRWTDVGVAAIYLVPALIGLIPPVVLPGLHIPLVAVCTVALLLRRRWPLPALGLTVVSSVVATLGVGSTNGHDLAVMLMVYTVASLRPPVIAWIATAGAIGVVTVGVLLWGDTTVPDAQGPAIDLRIVVSSTLAVMLLVAHAIGLSVRARREHTRALVDRANQLALERDQREQLATASERARIAREMHDVVAHSLSVMVALADGASASLARRPERSAAALEQLSKTGRSALSDMRRILGVLREESSASADDGVAPLQPTDGDLDELLGRFRDAGLAVRSVREGAPLPQDPALRLAVYRIAQESLTNVLRYASTAPSVTLALVRDSDVVRVTVSNGPPPTATPPRVGSGRGLIGMRERVAAYGGSVVAGPTPDGGWRVHAELEMQEDPT